MTTEAAPEETKQPRNPILVRFDECVKTAVSKGKRIDLGNVVTGSFSDKITFSTDLGSFPQKQFEDAISAFVQEISDPNEKVELVSSKKAGTDTTECWELKAKGGTFFLGKEITRDKRDRELKRTHYIRGTKTSLAERLRNVTSPLTHPQN